MREIWQERFAEAPDGLKNSKHRQTIVQVLDFEIGGEGFVTMAGPRSVETEFQLMATANHICRGGAHPSRRRLQAPQLSLCISIARPSRPEYSGPRSRRGRSCNRDRGHIGVRRADGDFIITTAQIYEPARQDCIVAPHAKNAATLEEIFTIYNPTTSTGA